MKINQHILTPENLEQFNSLQQQLIPQFQSQFPDPMAPKTVIIVPSLTLDTDILSKIKGHIHYEERMLCLLLLLRMPRTQVIYLSSMPIDEVIVDYYLHLISGITHRHARNRLTLLSCFDASHISLTAKILKRPRLIAQIKQLVPPNHVAHITAFNVTPLEEELALELGFPLYGCPSALSYWGSKSGSRELFKQAGIPIPPGYENLKSVDDILEALMALKADHPELKKTVIKLNEGFSGDGNAVYTYGKLPKITGDLLRTNLKIVAEDMNYDVFIQKIQQMGGIAEAFVDGEIKASPSVQCLINPLQEIDMVSTHDQILGGESGQVYLGAKFPADAAYRREIGELGYKVTQHMSTLGVLGRFGVDFVSVKEGDQWKHYAIEINLRKGGTSHPYLMLQLLTGGKYDYQSGVYIMPNGQTRCYIATDALIYENFKKLTPPDLIDIAICNNLHFDGSTQEGVMFHLIGAMSQHGKLGVLAIANTHERAETLYNKTISVLLNETN